MSAVSSPRFGDDAEEPGTTACAGCRRRICVATHQMVGRVTYHQPRGTNKVVAYSEDRDHYGRVRYWCRRCTMRLWSGS